MTMVAVVGVTGQVGRVMHTLLVECNFPANKVRFLASVYNAGRELEFRGGRIVVKDVTATFDEDLRGTDVAVFPAGGTLSKEQAPCFAVAGTVVVNNLSVWRKDPEVPLVISEANSDALQGTPKDIVTNPDRTTMAAMPVLKPLRDEAGLQRLRVSSYQVVSGPGLADVETLVGQVHENVDNLEQLTIDGSVLVVEDFSPYVVPIAFSVLPMVGNLVDDSSLETDEEQKLHSESRKILSVPELAVAGTCVRVPMLTGHALIVHVEFENALSVEKATESLEPAPGVKVVDVPSPLAVAGVDESLVDCIHVDQSVPKGRGLVLAVSGDNPCRGAVLNTIQITELLVAGQQLTAVLKSAKGQASTLSVGAFLLERGEPGSG